MNPRAERFGLIHDAAHEIRVCLDRDMKTDGRISFHPNINTATFAIAFADFDRFLASRRNVVRYVTIASDA